MNPRRIAVPALAAFAVLAGVRAPAQQPTLPAGDRGVRQASEPDTSAAISGTVIDAVSGLPVAGAIVRLSRADTRGVILPSMRTDARGRFVLHSLPAAPDYFLDARAFGYASTRYGWTGPGQSSVISDIKRIPLADGQWIADIRIPLWKLGAINGRVVDERGEPVTGVAVRALSTAQVSGQPQLVAGPVTTTDDRGIYRLSGLHPARYLIAVLSVQSTVLNTTPEVPPVRPLGELASGGIGGGRGAIVATPAIDVDHRHRLALSNFATPPPPQAGAARAYQTLFYPGATASTEAQTIEIAYGDNRRGIDFQLRPVPAVRISGRVEAPAALPMLLLRMLPKGSERLGFGFEAATTVVGSDGRFTFLNVPAGDYSIIVQPSVLDFTSGSTSLRMPDAPGFPAGGIAVGSFDAAPGLGYLNRRTDSESGWTSMEVSVSTHDLDDLVLRLHPTTTIRGRIAVVEGAPKPANPPLLTAEPADGNPMLGYPMGHADQSFTFSITGLWGGRYLLRSWASLGMVSVAWNGRDMMRTGFDASAGQDYDDVVVTFTDKPVELRGTVSGIPENVTAAVIAFPVERDRWVSYGWNPPFFRVTRAGASGDYRLQNLAEGEYFLVAVPASQRDAWVNPAFLAAAAPLATRVSLKWGDTRTQNVRFVEPKVK